MGATSGLNGFFPDHLPCTAIVFKVAANCDSEFEFQRFIIRELSNSPKALSSIVINKPHRLGSASFGVKVSPLPVPNSFQNLIAGFRLSTRRSSAIRNIAQIILERFTFQK
jgi:hypothetical protein